MDTRVATIADRIELALRRLGRWSGAPIDPARLTDMGPFGMKTLAAEEWLEHVLVPRLRGGAPLPSESQLGVWATRQFDGDLDAAPLLDVLGELDALVEEPVRETIARVIAICERLPMVKAAYVVQFFAPHTGQLTTPALGLELDAALPADAFAAWPENEPLIVFGIGDDGMSRLARLTPPVYTAP